MARGHANLIMEGINVQEPDGKALQDWSRLEDIYREVGQGIMTVGEEVNQAIAAIRAAKLTETTELSLAVKTLSDDLLRFTDTVVAIHNRHKQYVGPVIDANLLTLYLSCGNDYTTLHEQFRALVFPAMETITDFAMRARDKLLAEVKAEEGGLTPEQDPSIITDVEVKEENKQ